MNGKIIIVFVLPPKVNPFREFKFGSYEAKDVFVFTAGMETCASILRCTHAK